MNRRSSADIAHHYKLTGKPAPSYGLAHDLLARLRAVPVPPLSDRVADIPGIFHRVLETALKRRGVEDTEVIFLLMGDHYEALCLDQYRHPTAMIPKPAKRHLHCNLEREEPFEVPLGYPFCCLNLHRDLGTS